MSIKSIVFLSALLAAMALPGCEREGPAERAGEQIDETVEHAAEEAEQAADEVGEAVENAGDELEKQAQ